MKENKKYRVELPDADAVLRERCEHAAEDIYGTPLPEPVNSRLKEELSAIEANHYASDYLTAAMITDASKKEGYPANTRGMLGSSLTAFLCGVTAVNPLPAHYCCPKCHHFELADEEAGNFRGMGYDLPERVCPVCGIELNADGADVRPEVLMGIDMNREPGIAINVAAQIRPKIAEYIKTTFGKDRVFRAGVKAEREDGSIKRGIHPGGIFIIPEGCDIADITPLRDSIDEEFQMPVTETDYHDLDDKLKKYDLLTLPGLDMLHALTESTGVSSDQIKTSDQGVLETLIQGGFASLSRKGAEGINDFEKTVIQSVKPRSFADLVKVSGLLHGAETWLGNGEELTKDGIPLQDLIAFRDDVMQYLLKKGFGRRRAFEIMESVRKGRGVTDEMALEMTAAGVPNWYIESCRKVEYLFPKAHAAEYMLMYWKIAYFKRYYTEEYRMARETFGREPEYL